MNTILLSYTVRFQRLYQKCLLEREQLVCPYTLNDEGMNKGFVISAVGLGGRLQPLDATGMPRPVAPDS